MTQAVPRSATQQLSAISASRRGTLYSRVADSSRRRGFETLTRTVARSSVQAVALLDALYAFYQEHERCGDLDSGLEGDRVWMACSACGATMSRGLEPAEESQ